LARAQESCLTNSPENVMHTPRKPHPTETAKYWRDLAHTERVIAEQERTGRFGTVESIRMRLQHAADYEATAAKIEAQERAE
jgi:hypothetical protein